MPIKKATDLIFPVGKAELSQASYYRALSEANSGFYPFGENGLWHGGIHIDKAVLKQVGSDDKLCCMANGEVVAYRVNGVYPKIIHDDNLALKSPYSAQQRVAYFSTGFTLVRHYLAMPKVTGSAEAPPAITLYSLYMHQLDWHGYQQKQQHEPTSLSYPYFWSVSSGQITAAKETIKGSVIRSEGSKTEVRGLLLKGSKIRLGAQKGNSGWYQIISISAGTLVTLKGMTLNLGNITGYVYKGDVAPVPTGKKADSEIDYVVSGEDNSQLGPDKIEVKGIAVYATASESQKLTYLPQGVKLDFDGQEKGYAKIRRISGSEVPSQLMVKNGCPEAPHWGYVKISSLSSVAYQPAKLDEVVVLDQPLPISAGDFIGYIGHNVSQKASFNEPKEMSLATTKRPSDKDLPLLSHVELFTCDDLPAFISRSRTLADSLPESEQTIILVEPGARLIQPSSAKGYLPRGLGITFTGDTAYFYLKIKPEYRLTMPSSLFERTRMVDSVEINLPQTDGNYCLIQDDKTWLINRYQSDYPELNLTDIPDVVELASQVLAPIGNDFTICFSPKNKHYWIKAEEVTYLNRQAGQLNARIDYWDKFPLSLTPLPDAQDNNTVDLPRTLSLDSLTTDNQVAVDEANNNWAYIMTANKHGEPIHGWVNIDKNAQPHIKRVTPWHWAGFNTLEEQTSVGELAWKLNHNKATRLDLADYTPAMSVLHTILTNTPLNTVQRKKGLPPFTAQHLKAGLGCLWTAEQIGHLAIRYESEWYADEELSKWQEIDEFYQREKAQEKSLIESLLGKHNITQPYQGKYTLQILDESYAKVTKDWQLEKAERIKPSLWWQAVAQAQAAQMQTTNQANPPLILHT